MSHETGINQGAHVELGPDGRSFRSLPTRHGSTSVLEAKLEWEQSLPLTSELSDTGDGQLKGTFSHQWDGELIDWVLAYRSFAYIPSHDDTGVEPPLRAGDTIDAQQVPSRILADYLVRLRTREIARQDRQSSDFSLSRETYDPLGRDLFTLLRTTTFHDVMGASAYTGLTNSTLQREDLTRLVRTDRAVIFGRLRNAAYGDHDAATENTSGSPETLAAQYTVDGKPVSPRYRECFVRWILPVKQLDVTPLGP